MSSRNPGHGRMKKTGRNLVYKCVLNIKGKNVEIEGTGSSEMQARYAIRANLEKWCGVMLTDKQMHGLQLIFVRDLNNKPKPNTDDGSTNDEPKPNDDNKPKWIQGNLNFGE